MTTTTDPYAGFGTIATPQREQVPGRPEQVKNNAGGYVFEIDKISQLTRFLTIGSAGGTFYVSEKNLTAENGNLVVALATDPGYSKKLVDTIVEVSVAGRARKPEPALFALAIACQLGDTEDKQYARAQINKVVRTGTHLFTFVGYLKQFGGLGRGLRRSLGDWYGTKEVDDLALQLIKYRQRAGYTHRDVLRLSHPKIEGPGRRAAIEWAVKGKAEDEQSLPDFIKFFEMAQAPDAEIPTLLKNTYLPWEALPDSAMNDKDVWRQMIENGVPINALMRQLSRLTNLELLSPMAGGELATVVGTLTNPELVAKSKVHPFAVLVALKTYARGYGERNQWTPVPAVIDALDEMYYMAFKNVEPTGKRILNALDISGSMGSSAGDLPLTCAEVAAALAMVSVQTETNQLTMGFSSLSGTNSRDPRNSKLIDLPFSRRQRLDDAVRITSQNVFGGTDCALPMIHALHNNIKVDTFVVYTDNETYAGAVHPYQALAQYRKTMGIDSRLVVVSITPTKFSFADPRDAGMLDISGFDASVPQLIADFSAGRI